MVRQFICVPELQQSFDTHKAMFQKGEKPIFSPGRMEWLSLSLYNNPGSITLHLGLLQREATSPADSEFCRAGEEWETPKTTSLATKLSLAGSTAPKMKWTHADTETELLHTMRKENE